MRREPILDSTTIASAGYDPQKHELEIEFQDSRDVYRYFEVPADEYAALLAAPSRGAYFNRIFKPHGYRYRRIRQGRKQWKP
jgi:hypothetical protein